MGSAASQALVGSQPPIGAGVGEPVPVDPLGQPEWDSLVGGHPEGSFFHQAAWARVLRETYGHQPFYFCQLAEGKLEGLLAIMEVSSPWTGRRGVSLPFTDFCVPLGPPKLRDRLYARAVEFGRERGWRYLECRGNDTSWPGSSPSLAFYAHAVDLTPGAERLFERCESSVRRAIRKAEKSVRVEFATDERAMRDFYKLHCQTRRKHGVPPQPFRFFQNILRFVLGNGHGFIATAVTEGKPVAASVFFHAGREAIYKFGASDKRYQHLRPSNLVMWEAIKKLAAERKVTLHLGRTSVSNGGLRRFKSGFGAREERFEYFRYDLRKAAFVTSVDRAEGSVNELFRWLPGPLFRLAGRLLYPHLS